MKESSQEEACGTGLKDQQVLGVHGYAQLFHHSVERLRSQLIEKGEGAASLGQGENSKDEQCPIYTVYTVGAKIIRTLGIFKVQLNWPVQFP